MIDIESVKARNPEGVDAVCGHPLSVHDAVYGESAALSMCWRCGPTRLHPVVVAEGRSRWTRWKLRLLRLVKKLPGEAETE